MSLTTDRNDPLLKEGQKNESGQHDIYLVLSEEERARGFVRPVRDTYVHVGKTQSHYKRIWYMLSERNEDHDRDMITKGYVAVMVQLEDEDGKPIGGGYVNQEQLDAWEKGERVGGCGTETKMGAALAETYARDPKFYGATFCVHCNKHLPVEEFIWKGTNETVGS